MQLKKLIKEYFSFTLKERIGIVVLIVVVFVAFVLPGMIPRTKTLPDIEQEEMAAIAKTLRSQQPFKLDHFDENNARYEEKASREYSGSRARELFLFDPNTASKEEWVRLGVREKTALTIMKYVSRGGYFRKPEDLKKIYGLPAELSERLMPFVRIEGSPHTENFHSTALTERPRQKEFTNRLKIEPERKENVIVDITRADSAEFESLPGIGSKLAGRIVHFRKSLGGFHSVQQIGEVYGLADSAFQKIMPMLRVSEVSLKRININKSDVYALKSHPYIGWRVANLLVKYRQQHGDFTSPVSIRDIHGISAELAIKLLPYLSID